MAEDWNFYLCRVDDKPASIFLDLALHDQAPVPAFRQLGYAHVFMRQPRPDGLSSSEEFETLSQIDEALDQAVATLAGRYVGRLTTDGTRTYYFYGANAASFEAAFSAAMRGFAGYEFETGQRDDPGWSIYRDFLYPGPADRQRIANQKVVNALLDRGDKPQLPRPIEHWAYFPDATRASAFIAWLQARDFRILRSDPVEQGSHLVLFMRVDQPSAIDEVVLPLHAHAEELGGEYDGWECQAIAPGED
ncbi:DUF695 domain-containing protein [Sphingomonas sp. BT-65]|uniref:DUF695 domain-containing protein n=1 Tax=Sphingomonas sp. BT-65 TaxID=2989821 RepID=UPI0022366175|nr:DUF695 domain-containing protein [Sphingomonas sp. BT-65]MCW4462427.1 DUF695 domain-containing protein [Sphingomonas sp. BT-65]